MMAASHSNDIRHSVLIAIALMIILELPAHSCLAFQQQFQYFRPLRPQQCQQNARKRGQPTTLHIWGFGSDKKAGSSSNNKKPDTTLGDTTAASKSGTLGGVAGIMDSMEGFKYSQRIGKRTGALVQELMMLNVEGVAEGGKVKVTLDGQQRPVSTYIDEAYLEAAEAADVAAAITLAMKDAHTKSTEKMDEKIKNFFNEMGLPG